MILSNNYKAFLALVRLGIGHPTSGLPDDFEWAAVQTIANQHGLTAVVLDGIEKLPDNKRPPKDVALQWIGEVLHFYEQRYERYKKAIAELAGFYNAHGHRMMVLKGYACSLNWPKPEYRPSGDIDIWLFGKQEEADTVVQNEKGIKVDKSEHHHTVFYWKDFMVENHYDFLNIFQHRSSVKMEKILKQLGNDDSFSVDLYGENIYLPSPNLHAFFLLKHSMCHFAAESITLRQLLDWAFFVEKEGKNVDWRWLEGVLEEYGMMPLFHIYNAICVEDLGFDSSLFLSIQFNPHFKERVLDEILCPEFSTKMPKGFTKRVIYKFRRWYKSAWKHKLCYKESMWESFWSGVWMHLLKPSQI